MSSFLFCLYFSARRVIRCSFLLSDIIFPFIFYIPRCSSFSGPLPGPFLPPYLPAAFPSRVFVLLEIYNFLFRCFHSPQNGLAYCLTSAGVRVKTWLCPYLALQLHSQPPNHPFPFLGHSILISLQCLKRTRTAT